MAKLFKGAGPGTHWWTNDARTAGGFSCPPGRPSSAAAVVNHITVASHPSPYISFTASFAIAFEYAANGPSGAATAANPGYVYEIDTSLASLTMHDPVKEIATAGSIGRNGTLATHHDGGPDLILAIANPTLHGTVLRSPARRLGTALPRPPGVTDELNAIVYALRDAEVLLGAVPPACIVARHPVS